MEYNYTAIVLKKRKIGETDRLYTFYTLEAGKLQAIGRGIRKPRAKLAGHLETLSQTDIVVARRHGLGNIAGAIAERYWVSLRSDETALQSVVRAVHAFERLVDFEERDETLFLLLQAYLAAVDGAIRDGHSDKVRVVTQGFLFRLLEHLGYRLETSACVVSGAALSADVRYVFSPESGGVAKEHLAKQLRQTVPITVNAIKLMRLFSTNTLASLIKLSVGHEDVRCLESVSQSFIRWLDR